MKGVTLFSGAGIGEAYLGELGLEVVVANELIEKRAGLYRKLYPESTMVCGDILEDNIFDTILRESGSVDFLIASPPCQGLSIAGKNRTSKEINSDVRNHLIKKVIDFITIKKPPYIIIENVPKLLDLALDIDGVITPLVTHLNNQFSHDYFIEARVIDAKDYGVPQKRKRAIIKLCKRSRDWPWPKSQKEITVKETIGHLPTLESGQKSDIEWHFARTHIDRHILWMKHTPSGQSAFKNKIHFPKKANGERIKGFESSYRRIKWDEPSPSITIRNDAISSQRNVHPGVKLSDGTYSDSRVLTTLELMLLMSLPSDWHLPVNTPEILIRQCIGEAIPPKLISNLFETLAFEEESETTENRLKRVEI